MTFFHFACIVGTLRGKFKHLKFWPYLDFLLQQQIKLVLTLQSKRNLKCGIQKNKNDRAWKSQSLPQTILIVYEKESEVTLHHSH